ncbi:MAG TPA: hypothetical protein VK735_39490 [Pseudonocardia sp.]|uniref:hypothetical protein n=1 Tax=Pseudonocardia sp. TaxID=60912 RepID=UPI002C8C194D|nr:hypothetical protein [Pseudonocardia sp.]HTF53566.1 hypothetical protein [Pseudonocardia sp.]
MADNRLAEAIDIIAREHIFKRARKPSPTAYIFLSQSQWQAFVDRVLELTDPPRHEDYRAARRYLETHRIEEPRKRVTGDENVQKG